MFIEQKRINQDLHIFCTVICALIIIGFLFIYSASSIFALEKFGSSLFFVKKQLIGLFVGVVALIVCMIIPLSFIRNASPLFLVGSLLLTALTFIPSITYRIHGSSRWLHMGPLSFQPSELLKISLILYTAYFLTKELSLKTSSYRYGWLGFIVGLSCFLLLKQPDFGMAVTIALTIFLMVFIMHMHTKYVLAIISTAIPAVIFLIYIQPYRWKRILTFFNPWSDPQGAGFQIIQSLIAIGSGSFWGIGVSHSKQKFFYLPMQHTDFIFSILAEETGFIGSILLIALYLAFLYFGMRLAWRLKNLFSVLLTTGFVILISLQAIINLAVTTGLLPTKGIGLPFISYGNSSLVCQLAMIGLIINCVRESRL